MVRSSLKTPQRESFFQPIGAACCWHGRGKMKYYRVAKTFGGIEVNDIDFFCLEPSKEWMCRRIYKVLEESRHVLSLEGILERVVPVSFHAHNDTVYFRYRNFITTLDTAWVVLISTESIVSVDFKSDTQKLLYRENGLKI